MILHTIIIMYIQPGIIVKKRIELIQITEFQPQNSSSMISVG